MLLKPYRLYQVLHERLWPMPGGCFANLSDKLEPDLSWADACNLAGVFNRALTWIATQVQAASDSNTDPAKILADLDLCPENGYILQQTTIFRAVKDEHALVITLCTQTMPFIVHGFSLL